MTTGELSAPFPQPHPSWPAARWVGVLDDHDPRLHEATLPLLGGQGYQRARLLVRHRGAPRGFVEATVTDGAVATAELTAGIDGLPDIMPPRALPDPPPGITVALCTRDRADQLPTAVDSLLALDYPELTVLVVDNASRTDDAVRYVHELGDERVRVVYEPRPGLSCARNRALVEATTDWVAFTDDDVVADPGWLLGLARGIVHPSHPAVVCDSVATGELASAAALYFEQRIEWGDLTSAVFTLAEPPADVPLFPFEVGVYGTGANFAVDRHVAIGLGGFNEALGAGTPTGGGEDIDMFVRAVVAGHSLIRETSALVWHRHRDTADALRIQMGAYGVGMSAWMFSVLGDRTMRGLALRKALGVVRRLPDFAGNATGTDDATAASGQQDDAGLGDLRGLQVRGLLRGPFAYARSRAAGRATRPLAVARS